MILALFTLCIVVMRCFPETPIARLLNRALVDQPLAQISKIKRRHIIFVCVVAALLLVAGDFLAIFGAAELLALGMNLSIYLDAVLITAAVTVSAAAMTTWRAVRARMAPRRRGGARGLRRALREKRKARSQQPQSPGDDDEPAWDFAFAA